MKCEEIYSNLVKVIPKFSELIEERAMIESEIMRDQIELGLDPWQVVMPEKENNFLKCEKKFQDLFNRLYVESIKESYYWEYCTFDIYSKSIEKRKADYGQTFHDSDDVDFWREELNIMSNKRMDSHYDVGFIFFHNSYRINLDKQRVGSEMIKNLNFSEKKKSEFVENKLQQFEPSNVEKIVPEENFEIGGKKMTLSDRYYVTEHVLNASDAISKLNLSQADKHKILATVLSCHIDNAKHLFNGTYPPYYNLSDERREQLIDYFKLNDIKKG